MIPSNTLVAHPLSRVKKKHPARATPGILEVMSQWMNPGDLVLNPFSGTGRMAEIPGINPVLVEIEKDWATHVCGDATALPFADNTFDVVAFSPTYGNRFADHHKAKDSSTRRSYTHDIGHPLHPNNSGDKQWGSAYWDLHRKAYPEIIRTLKNHGTFILNIKDHYRGKMLIPVSEWHVGLLTMCGLTLMEQVKVPVPSMRMGKNHEARVEFEWVFVFDNFDYWGTAPIILS